jgi:hypothetical protein
VIRLKLLVDAVLDLPDVRKDMRNDLRCTLAKLRRSTKIEPFMVVWSCGECEVGVKEVGKRV